MGAIKCKNLGACWLGHRVAASLVQHRGLHVPIPTYPYSDIGSRCRNSSTFLHTAIPTCPYSDEPTYPYSDIPLFRHALFRHTPIPTYPYSDIPLFRQKLFIRLYIYILIKYSYICIFNKNSCVIIFRFDWNIITTNINNKYVIINK